MIAESLLISLNLLFSSVHKVERESRCYIFESPNLRHWPGGDSNISPFLVVNIASIFPLTFSANINFTDFFTFLDFKLAFSIFHSHRLLLVQLMTILVLENNNIDFRYISNWLTVHNVCIGQ